MPCDRKSGGAKEEGEETEDGIKEEDGVKDDDEDEPTRNRKDAEEVQVRDVQYKLENLDSQIGILFWTQMPIYTLPKG